MYMQWCQWAESLKAPAVTSLEESHLKHLRDVVAGESLNAHAVTSLGEIHLV